MRTERCSEPCVTWQDKPLEAEASDALGGVYQLMADNETALQVGADSPLRVVTGRRYIC